MISLRFGSTAGLFFLLFSTAAAQDSSIVGIWQAREGTPSGLAPGVSASDVQTLYLDAQGNYRREIIVEGGLGAGGGANPPQGAGGKIIDAGFYRFTPPDSFQYSRQSYTICSVRCSPYPPAGPNAGTIPFVLLGQGRTQFIGLVWTKVQ
jgi:hypothetical protein